MNLAAMLFFRTFKSHAFLILLAISTRYCHAATVWNGPTVTFTKAAFADWTQPANQDRITDNVWITRTNSHGIFNIKAEPFFTHSFDEGVLKWLARFTT